MKKILFAVIVAVSSSLLLLSLKTGKLDNPLPLTAVADKILIEKSKRRLTLLKSDRPLKTYKIALGRNPQGKKTEEGDGRTPEGMYTIDRRKSKSSYHKALHISYPNSSDVALAKSKGVSPGGDIMIHGLPNLLGFIGKYHTITDWTKGCVAVSSEEIEEICRAVSDGTPVEIVP